MLKNEGKKIYKELSEYLKKHSTLEEADVFTLTELSFYFQIFYESAKVVSKDGATQSNPNGYKSLSSEYKAMAEASKNIRSISRGIGIYDILKNKLHNYGKQTDKTKKYFD